MTGKKIEVSKALMLLILTYFEEYLPESIEAYADDAPECEVFDALMREFPQERLHALWPNVYEAEEK